MKVRLNALGLLFISCSLFGQTEKKGFIGLNVGTSHLLNARLEDSEVGANLSFINFGYSFKKGFGLSVKWMGGAHSLSEDYKLGYGAILVGPMYSIKLSESFLLDVKFQSGLFWVVEEIKFIPIDNNDPYLPSSAGKFSTGSLRGFSSGVSLRHNFAKHWSWMLLADYNNSGRAPGFFVTGERMHALSLNIGIGVRI